MILILVSNNASSETFNVNSEYKPATYDIEYGANNFKNTDICTIGDYLCTFGEYVLGLPIIAYRTPKNTGNKRDEPTFIKIKPKKVILKHKLSGEQQEMTLIPTVVGMEVSDLRYIPSTSDTWKNLRAVEGDCDSARFRGYGWTYRVQFIFATKNENMSSGCSVSFKYNPQYGYRLKIENVYLGFRLKTPNPLKMKNGDYTGTLDLLISPEGDIDLGNGSYSAAHTINFKLSVKHQIRVDFPQSSTEITLKPNDGWASGGRNTELSNDITYSLWASSNVNVSLRCQYKFNDACGIKNKKGHTVGLDVFNMENRHNKTLLKESTPLVINVTNPVIGNENKILFRVSNSSVTSMLNYPGSTYSGDVTIIYDASI